MVCTGDKRAMNHSVSTTSYADIEMATRQVTYVRWRHDYAQVDNGNRGMAVSDWVESGAYTPYRAASSGSYGALRPLQTRRAHS